MARMSIVDVTTWSGARDSHEGGMSPNHFFLLIRVNDGLAARRSL